MKQVRDRIIQELRQQLSDGASSSYDEAVHDAIQIVVEVDLPGGWSVFMECLDDFLNYYPESIFQDNKTLEMLRKIQKMEHERKGGS